MYLTTHNMCKCGSFHFRLPFFSLLLSIKSVRSESVDLLGFFFNEKKILLKNPIPNEN